MLTMTQEYTVLVVEDTEELAEINRMVLSGHSQLAVYIERDGNKAIEAYKTLQPDLILLDLNLPDIRGWKVLDAIRAMVEADDSLKMPKVIVTTAYSDAANRVMGKLQDVIEYMVKPFKPRELEHQVLKSLGILDE